MNILNLLWILSQNIFFTFAGIFGLGLLIGFHELGHFFFCKLFRIRTPSFSIGFGPNILTRKIGETEFKLSAIPFGGYVEIAGSAEVGQGKQEEAYSQDEHSVAVKPFWQKLLVMLGGILFNLLFSYTIFISLFMTGIPKTKLMYQTNVLPIIAGIHKDSAAEKHGLLAGDRILKINDVEINNNIQRLFEALEPLANKKATIFIEREGKRKKIAIVVDERKAFGKTIGILGIDLDVAETPPHPFFESIKRGIQTTNLWIKNTFHGFTHILSKKDVSGMAGPVMIVAMTIKGASAGLKIFLLFLAIISINLAVLNIIPIPILDGGQILFYGIEALIRRPLPEKIREYIHIATWIMFLILFIYLSAQDITRIASPHIEALLKFLRIR